MAAVPFRSRFEEALRALKPRAVWRHRSAEAEMIAILEEIHCLEGRVRVGTALSRYAQQIGLSNADVEALTRPR
jgi:plasmid stability protein